MSQVRTWTLSEDDCMLMIKAAASLYGKANKTEITELIRSMGSRLSRQAEIAEAHDVLGLHDDE